MCVCVFVSVCMCVCVRECVSAVLLPKIGRKLLSPHLVWCSRLCVFWIVISGAEFTQQARKKSTQNESFGGRTCQGRPHSGAER